MFEYISSLFSHPVQAQSQSEYGDDSLSTQDLKETGLLADLQAMGPNLGPNLLTLVEKALATGHPVDDRTMLMEKVIALLAQLPETSALRQKLSKKLVGGLFNSLQHPPTSYYGEQYQFRTFDGSFNNILSPNLGKAGTPYAKSVRSDRGLLGAKPDPGLLFDLLMQREDGKFVENPAGLNSVLFYHASIIIHDVFRTNRKDPNISDTSSYLDLAPLYGSSKEDQDGIRTWKDGKLKADTFAEERLLGQPPGVSVMLVMYNRFHNYVCDQLVAINDEGRFTMPREGIASYEEACLKRDNAIFQTARLIVGGLYVNISLHDYIRGITNINHSPSTWTLDPRVEVTEQADGYDVERGCGNQVSAEFNLLYRFHSAISEKDDKWTADFFRGVFGNKSPEEITIPDFIQGFLAWEKTIPKDPSKRVFGGLTRDPNTGRFNDAALVKILEDSITDPAGSFGARNVPKYLRVIEILGILQARKWQVASLNEFRTFFGLKKHDTFESINPDPYVADILRKLYSSPDLVELYPGLFVEDAKKRMDPGSGFAAPYTVGRAVLSDAVNLVRGDRFNTLDYTNATLTAWGMAEVKQDYGTLGGSSMYKLIQRAFPGWFKFNSVYVMQPMYTPKMNAQIIKELGTASSFCLDPPAPPTRMTILNTHAAISALLADNVNFKVRYGQSLPDLIFADFMLSGDSIANTKNHNLTRKELMGGCPAGMHMFEDWFETKTRQILARESYKLKDVYQVDITKDIARVVVIHMHSELLNLPLLAKGQSGDGLSEEDMYKYVSTLLQYVILDNDPAESWNLRKRAREGVKKLKAVTEARVRETSRMGGLVGAYFGSSAAPKGSLLEIGQNLTKKLLNSGYSVEDTATTLFTSAAGGVPNTPNSFIQTLDWFLTPQNKKHWDAVKKLANNDSRTARDQLKAYVLEAQRLSSGLGITRICTPSSGKATVIKNDQGADVIINKGELVICNCTAAFRDPVAFPQPNEVNLDRPVDSYPMWGMASHGCIGREIAIVGIVSMIRVCAQLKGLRRAPGAPGQLKSIPGPLGSKKYLNDDWSRFSPFATTWKVQFDDF